MTTATQNETAEHQGEHQPSAGGGELSHPPKNWNPGDPTDGKKQYEFESRYPFCCRVEMFLESMYLVILMTVSACFIYSIIAGNIQLLSINTHCVASDAQQCGSIDLQKKILQFIAFPVAGLMGGTMFGLKWQYRVAARGWWHRDRRIWRLCSPWLSASLAMMIGLAIDGGLLGLSFTHSENSVSTLLSIGFITGYFADSALAKLQEIASVVFGSKTEPQSSSKQS